MNTLKKLILTLVALVFAPLWAEPVEVTRGTESCGWFADAEIEIASKPTDKTFFLGQQQPKCLTSGCTAFNLGLGHAEKLYVYYFCPTSAQTVDEKYWAPGYSYVANYARHYVSGNYANRCVCKMNAEAKEGNMTCKCWSKNEKKWKDNIYYLESWKDEILNVDDNGNWSAQ